MLSHFEYAAPSSMKEALAALQADGVEAIAGGTDLLVQMRDGAVRPNQLVDLTELDLSYVREEADWIEIGATTTFAELIESQTISSKLPALAEAAGEIGVVQTRNLATIGGNVCSAVPSADAAPPLLALGATVDIVGPEGSRNVPVDGFFVGPRETVLERGEVVVAFRIPIPAERSGSSFHKRGRRKALTLAVVNAAAYVEASEDLRTVQEVRISLGAVAPTPIRAWDAEAALRGREFSERLIDEVGVTACREIAPIDDIRATAACRDHISNQLVKQALTTAWQRATGQAHYEEVS